MSTSLRRFLVEPADRGPEQPQIERCELCGEPAGEQHGHVVDLHSRNILCACRPCYMLFTPTGAGGQRFCAIPERYRYTPEFAINPSTWDSIGIPVGMAFFFTNSDIGAPAAFYPSPAGATECLLPLDEWRRVLDDNPAFADAAEDTEALLLNKVGDRFECFLVPIDECYRLTGIVKMRWRGFDGGTEAWQAIDGFFDELRARSARVEPGDG